MKTLTKKDAKWLLAAVNALLETYGYADATTLADVKVKLDVLTAPPPALEIRNVLSLTEMGAALLTVTASRTTSRKFMVVAGDTRQPVTAKITPKQPFTLEFSDLYGSVVLMDARGKKELARVESSAQSSLVPTLTWDGSAETLTLTIEEKGGGGRKPVRYRFGLDEGDNLWSSGEVQLKSGGKLEVPVSAEKVGDAAWVRFWLLGQDVETLTIPAKPPKLTLESVLWGVGEFTGKVVALIKNTGKGNMLTTLPFAAEVNGEVHVGGHIPMLKVGEVHTEYFENLNGGETLTVYTQIGEEKVALFTVIVPEKPVEEPATLPTLTVSNVRWEGALVLADVTNPTDSAVVVKITVPEMGWSVNTDVLQIEAGQTVTLEFTGLAVSDVVTVNTDGGELFNFTVPAPVNVPAPESGD